MFITGQFHVVWQEAVCVRLRVRERAAQGLICVHACEYVCKNTMPGFCFVIFHNHSALY